MPPRSSDNTDPTVWPLTERTMDLLLQVFAVSAEIRARWHRTWTGMAFVLILCAGCGRSATSSPGSAETDEPTAPDSIMKTTSTNGVESGRNSNESFPEAVEHGRGEVWTDEKGQKWFGNVPMDAFYDQPYAVASNSTSITGAATATVEVSDEEKSDVPVAAPELTSGGSWNDLISATELDAEVKAIRNFLNENLQSVSNYNSSMLMIPPKAATLGALAGIAMEHSDSVSWKDDAKYVRDLAKKMNADTLRSGPKDQKRLFELYENLSDTLNRSRPANLEEPPASDGFADVSEMRLLMHRMEEAEKRLKTEAGNESAMASRNEMVAHEATLMATLAKIVTLPGYGYEDDPQFKDYAEKVSQAALAIKVAATDNDFSGFELALTKVSTTCSNCHSDYKNN